MRIRLCEATIQDIDRRFGNNVRVQRSKKYSVRIKEYILDPLYVVFEVTGGAKPYEVHLAFEDVSPKTVTALKKSLRNGQSKISCSCDDFRYRFSYWSTRRNFGLDNEHRPAKIRNPNDSLGPACKHVAAVIKNTNWVYSLMADMKKGNTHKDDEKKDETEHET